MRDEWSPVKFENCERILLKNKKITKSDLLTFYFYRSIVVVVKIVSMRVEIRDVNQMEKRERRNVKIIRH